MRKITKHIVHCSATETGDVKVFRNYHVNIRKWRDVGYHFVIRKDGEIEVGRTLNEVGAHARGYNKDSIGTCLVGNNDFNEEQFKALKRIDEMLKVMFPGITTHGHREFNKYKTCPNFDVKDILG